jgi:phage shock protein E
LLKVARQRIVRRMDWITLLVILAVVAAYLLYKQLGLVKAGQARELLRQGAKVIDVRSPAEFESGHLPGVINIPLGELAERIGGEVANKEQAILLHCLSGGRSGLGKRILRSNGYTNVHNLGSYGRAEKVLSGGAGHG